MFSWEGDHVCIYNIYLSNHTVFLLASFQPNMIKGDSKLANERETFFERQEEVGKLETQPL